MTMGIVIEFPTKADHSRNRLKKAVHMMHQAVLEQKDRMQEFRDNMDELHAATATLKDECHAYKKSLNRIDRRNGILNQKARKLSITMSKATA